MSSGSGRDGDEEGCTGFFVYMWRCEVLFGCF